MNEATYQAALQALKEAGEDTSSPRYENLWGGSPKPHRIVKLLAPIFEQAALVQAETLASALERLLGKECPSAMPCDAHRALAAYRASR